MAEVSCTKELICIFGQAGTHFPRGFPCDSSVADSDANETFASILDLLMRANP